MMSEHVCSVRIIITTKHQDGCGVVDVQQRIEQLKWKMNRGLF